MKPLLLMSIVAVLIITFEAEAGATSVDGAASPEEAAEAAAAVAALVRLPPVITRHPPRQLAAAPGEPVRLICDAVGAAPLTFQWRRNSVRIVGNASVLLLASPNAQDEGVYQCHASNSLGTAVSIKTVLRVASLAPFPLEAEATIERSEGDSLRLQCKVPSSYPAATVLWHRVDDAAGRMSTPPVSNRVAIDPSDGSLLFANLLPSDGNARYQCGARNDVVRRTVEGRAYRLLVRPAAPTTAIKPTQLMAQSQRSLRLLGNQSADLFCFFSGRPTPDIRWTRSGGAPLLTEDSRRRLSEATPPFRLLESNTRLQIVQGSAELHAGGYVCVGDNGVGGVGGNNTGGFSVEVASEPNWVERPAHAVVAEGDSHAFTCRAAGADGSPEWLVNGRLIGLDSRGRTVGQRLLFVNLSRSDSLVVQCNCSNRYGYAFANAYLRVVSQPPIIIRPPGRLVAPAGADLRVPCGSFAAPKPTVEWTQDERPLLTAERREIQVDGDLLIRRLEASDSGTYGCVVSNRFGAASAIGSLTVRLPTRITEAPADVRVTEGRRVRLLCRADTDPLERHRLTIAWLRDGRPVAAAAAAKSDVVDEGGDSDLTIATATPADSGLYTCVAANGLDSDSRSARLLVLGRPGPPPGPPRIDCSDPSLGPAAHIGWAAAPDHNSPVLRYVVEFTTQYSPGGVWQPAETVAAAAEVEGAPPALRMTVQLRPGIDYEFRVRGFNAIGEGAASEAASAGPACRQPPARPARNPSGLRVEGGPQRSLAVTWQPLNPLDYGADGLVYVLRISCLDCDGEGGVGGYNETVVSDPSQGRLELHDVRIDGVARPIGTYRRYLAQIRARNSIGEAAAGPPPETTGRSNEEPPTVVPGDFRVSTARGDDALAWNSAWLTWTLERDPAGDPRVRGFYRGFRVTWCDGRNNDTDCVGQKRFQDLVFRQAPNSQSEPPMEPPSASAEGRHQLQKFEGRLIHLPGDASIRAYVHVINLRHTGPSSQPLDFRTPEGTPGQVGEFVLSLTGASHLEFDWSPPPQPNGRVTGYQLTYREVLGLPMGSLVAAPSIRDPSQHRGALAGLSPNTSYRVYIYARTAKGNGEPTFLDVHTAPPHTAPASSESGGGRDGGGGSSATVTASAAPIGGQALNVSVSLPSGAAAAQVRAFYVQYRALGGSGGDDGGGRWLETQREVRRRWLLIDNLRRDAWYEVRVVVANGAAAAGYTESLRVRTGAAGGGDGWGGLPQGSGATWLACGGLLLLLLLLLTSVVAFYCLAARRKRRGGHSDYQRGKPVATAAGDADIVDTTAAEDREYIGTNLHCSQFARLSLEGTKSFAFPDTSYLTGAGCGSEKVPPSGYSTIRGPAIPVSEYPLSYCQQHIRTAALPGPACQWQLANGAAGSNEASGQTSSMI